MSWRWLFLINVPLCLVALALGLRIVPHEDGVPGRRLDVRGLLLLPPGLALLTYGLARTTAGGGVDPRRIGALVAGVALCGGFVVHGRGLGRDALLDLGLLADRGFRACATLAASFGALMFGMLFLLPLYWESIRGATPLEAGLLMVPQGIGSLISLLVVGRLADRHGSRTVVLVGLVVASLATIPFVLADESTPVAPAARRPRAAGDGAERGAHAGECGGVPGTAAGGGALRDQPADGAAARGRLARRRGRRGGAAEPGRRGAARARPPRSRSTSCTAGRARWPRRWRRRSA